MFSMKFLSIAIMAITPSQMREPDVRPSIHEAGISFNETTVSPVDMASTVEMPSGFPVAVDGFNDSTNSLEGFETISVTAMFNETATVGIPVNSTVEMQNQIVLSSSAVDDVHRPTTANSFADFKADITTAAANDFGNDLSTMFNTFQVVLQDLSYGMFHVITELYVDVLEAWCPGATDYLRVLWNTINIMSRQLLQDFMEIITEFKSFLATYDPLDLLDAIDMNVQQVYDGFKLFIAELTVESVMTDPVQAFSAAYHRAFPKFEVPEPEPTSSLDSIARFTLNRISLEYQRVNESVASIYHDLLAPVTPPPPPTTWAAKLDASWESFSDSMARSMLRMFRRVERKVVQCARTKQKKDFINGWFPSPVVSWDLQLEPELKCVLVWEESPPTWSEITTATYEKVESYITYLFVAPPPTAPTPPPRTTMEAELTVLPMEERLLQITIFLLCFLVYIWVQEKKHQEDHRREMENAAREARERADREMEAQREWEEAQRAWEEASERAQREWEEAQREWEEAVKREARAQAQRAREQARARAQHAREQETLSKVAEAFEDLGLGKHDFADCKTTEDVVRIIRRRYYDLALTTHPDRDDGDTEDYIKVKEAYDFLINHFEKKQAASSSA